jgi:hypothetical protein
MIDSETYFSVVFKNLTPGDRQELFANYTCSNKVSASSYSHAMSDRDQLLAALAYAEAALSDIGDADREPGDDLAWCENRAAEALPRIRKLLAAHGKADPYWAVTRPLPAPENGL